MSDATIKKIARIIWQQGIALPEHNDHWEEIWEYETDPARAALIGEWWAVTAARAILALTSTERE